MTKNANITQPDPAWDYYLTYHKLMKAKSDLDKLISSVTDYEEAMPDLDESINEDLYDIIKALEDTRIPTNKASNTVFPQKNLPDFLTSIRDTSAKPHSQTSPDEPI